MTTKEFTKFFNHFTACITDVRIDRHKLYPLQEILFLIVVAILSGCHGWKEIEEYGKLNLARLRAFYEYRNGTPSDDTLRRLVRQSPAGCGWGA